jgi:dienelactone hydrolase
MTTGRPTGSAWLAALLAPLLFAGGPPAADSLRPLWGPLEPGPDPVGFRIVEARDASRGGRPLQIAVWYPSRPLPAGPTMTYRDYFALTVSQADLHAPSDGEVDRKASEFVAFLVRQSIPEATGWRWLAAPMLARRDAPPLDERFPLVLVAQGNGEGAPDQAVLCEYFASHGYVVATMPSPMAITGPMKSEEEIGERAEDQARDLRFLAHAASRWPNVREKDFGVMGYSFGARGALLFAMREPGVRAFVSLDGGIGTALGRNQMEKSPLFVTSGVRAPVLHAYEKEDAFMKPDFTLLHEVAHGGLEFLPTSGMHHVHFSTIGFAAVAFPEMAKATHAGPDLRESLARVARAALQLLDRTLAPAGALPVVTP